MNRDKLIKAITENMHPTSWDIERMGDAARVLLEFPTDDQVEAAAIMLHTFNCLPGCRHDPRVWEPNAQVLLNVVRDLIFGEGEA